MTCPIVNLDGLYLSLNLTAFITMADGLSSNYPNNSSKKYLPICPVILLFVLIDASFGFLSEGSVIMRPML